MLRARRRSAPAVGMSELYGPFLDGDGKPDVSALSTTLGSGPPRVACGQDLVTTPVELSSVSVPPWKSCAVPLDTE